MNGELTRAIKASRFKGAKAQTLTILAPVGTKLDRAFVVGLGKAKDIKSLGMQALGGGIYAALGSKGDKMVAVAIDALEGCKLNPAEMAAEVAYGARLRSFQFDKYRTKEKKTDKPTLNTLRVLCSGFARAKTVFAGKEKIADGVFFTRHLVSEPPNVIYPESLANQARTLTKLGVKVQVLNRARMQALGMGALLGVGKGSAREPKMVVMQWHGARQSAAKKRGGRADVPIAFVGKGVTFDSGGISIKPSRGMEDMKWDMGGAGVVIGLMKALAGRKARVDAVGAIIHPDDGELYAAASEGLQLLEPVNGGASRQKSARLGLESLAERRPDQVLIHDAAGPFVDEGVISRVVKALKTAPAAIPALPVNDTLKRGQAGRIVATVGRADLWRAPTPPGVRFRGILAAPRPYEGADLTHDAAGAEPGGRAGGLVAGRRANGQIPTEDDWRRAQQWLGGGTVRTGIGFDAHRYGPGEGVMLCGVFIPHPAALVAEARRRRRCKPDPQRR